MRQDRRRVLLAGLASLAAASVARAAQALSPADEAQALAWIAKAANRFGADPSARDLQPAVEALAGARIVGIGEASHGSHEDRLFKAALIRGLVEQGGCRVLALECNFFAGRALDRYVTAGTGDPMSLARVTGFFQVWQCEEMLDLIGWIRAWNLATKTPVRIVGIDCQAASRDAEFALTWLAGQDADQAAALRTDLDPVVGEAARATPLRTLVSGMTLAHARALMEALARLQALLAARREDWRAQPDYVEAVHAARAAWQGVSQVEFEAKDADPADRDGFYRARRDRYMADNAIAMSAGETAALWAHNGHVKPSEKGGDGESTGGYLRGQLGRGYRSVVFEYDHGVILAKRGGPNGPPPPSAPLVRLQRPSRPGGLGAALDRCGLERFWIDLGAAPRTPALEGFLAEPYIHDWPGWAAFEGPLGGRNREPLGRRMDLLVFFREITPSRMLPYVPTQ